MDKEEVSYTKSRSLQRTLPCQIAQDNPSQQERGTLMKIKLWKLCVTAQGFLKRDEGQDLIEYALVVALIAFAATAGMSSVANGINQAFSNIGTTISTYTA